MSKVALAVLILAIGCDDPLLLASADPTEPDPGAGAPDAGVPTAAGLVSIVVTLGGAPQEGVIVYFQNADSSLVASTTTDASGLASATMVAGGFVTAITPSMTPVQTEPAVSTFAGVKPGDVLTLDAIIETQLNVFSTAPLDPNSPSDVDYYLVYSTCSDGYTLVEPETQTSLDQSRTGLGDMMVVTTNGFQGAPIDYLYQPNVLVGNGSMIELYGSYQPAQHTTFNYTGLPSDGIVEMLSYIVTPRGVAYTSRVASTTVSSSTATTGLILPAITGTIAVTESVISESEDVGAPYHSILDWGAPSATYALDYGAARGIQRYIATPTYDVAHHSIDWTEEAGATPDYVDASYSVMRGGLHGIGWVWRIVAPRTSATSVTFPTLPITNGLDYNSEPGDQNYVDQVFNVSASIDYDAIRPWAFASISATAFATRVGGSGRVVISGFVPE